jgi:uncharacterized protein YceH (UPF0502 family)
MGKETNLQQVFSAGYKQMIAERESGGRRQSPFQHVFNATIDMAMASVTKSTKNSRVTKGTTLIEDGIFLTHKEFSNLLSNLDKLKE